MIITPDEARREGMSEHTDMTWDDRRNLTELPGDDIIDLVCSNPECKHTWSGPVTLVRIDGDYHFVIEETLRDADGTVIDEKVTEVFCPECGGTDIEREGVFQLEEYREKLRENWKLHQLTDLDTSQQREGIYPEKPYHKGYLIDETRVTPLERIMRRRKGWSGAQPTKRSGFHHWVCMKLGIHLNIRPTEHPWEIWKRPQFALECLVNALAEGNDWLEVKFVSQEVHVPGDGGWVHWATRERLEFLVPATVLPEEQLAELSTYIRLSYGKAKIMAEHNPPFFNWRDFSEFLETQGEAVPDDEEICSHVTKVEHQRANMPENISFKMVLFPEGNSFMPRPDIPDHPTCVDIVLDRVGELEAERAFELQLDALAEKRARDKWRVQAAIHKFETVPEFMPCEKTVVPKWVEQVKRPLRLPLKLAKAKVEKDETD